MGAINNCHLLKATSLRKSFSLCFFFLDSKENQLYFHVPQRTWIGSVFSFASGSPRRNMRNSTNTKRVFGASHVLTAMKIGRLRIRNLTTSKTAKDIVKRDGAPRTATTDQIGNKDGGISKNMRRKYALGRSVEKENCQLRCRVHNVDQLRRTRLTTKKSNTKSSKSLERRTSGSNLTDGKIAITTRWIGIQREKDVSASASKTATWLPFRRTKNSKRSRERCAWKILAAKSAGSD